MWAARLYEPASKAAADELLRDLSGSHDDARTVIAERPSQHARPDQDELACEQTRIARPGRAPAARPAPQQPYHLAVSALVPPPRRVPFSMAATVIQPRPTPRPQPLPRQEPVPRCQPAPTRREVTETGVIRAPRPFKSSSRTIRPDEKSGPGAVDYWGIAAAFASSALGGALLLTAAAWIVGGG